MCNEVATHEQFWLQEVKNLQTSCKGIIANYPDSDGVLQQVYKVLGDLVSLAGCTSTNVGESEQWVHTVNAAKNDKISFSKILKGKSLYSALYGTYTVALSELKAILQGSAKKNSPQPATATPTAALPQVKATDDGFREQRRRKRNNSSENETQRGSKKPAPHVERQKASKNFFAPMRTEMDTEEKEDDQLSEEQQRPAVAGRPPPIVLTSMVNLIHLQKKLKDLVKGSFEFRNTELELSQEK
jgi:hypothetical protein